MSDFDFRTTISAKPASDGGATAGALPKRASPVLSATAEEAAAERLPAAYSPIVLAGAVRMIELALVAFVGVAIYSGYVIPHEGFEWHYLGAIAGIALLAMLAFQIADIYQVQAF